MSSSYSSSALLRAFNQIAVMPLLRGDAADVRAHLEKLKSRPTQLAAAAHWFATQSLSMPARRAAYEAVGPVLPALLRTDLHACALAGRWLEESAPLDAARFAARLYVRLAVEEGARRRRPALIEPASWLAETAPTPSEREYRAQRLGHVLEETRRAQPYPTLAWATCATVRHPPENPIHHVASVCIARARAEGYSLPPVVLEMEKKLVRLDSLIKGGEEDLAYQFVEAVDGVENLPRCGMPYMVRLGAGVLSHFAAAHPGENVHLWRTVEHIFNQTGDKTLVTRLHSGSPEPNYREQKALDAVVEAALCRDLPSQRGNHRLPPPPEGWQGRALSTLVALAATRNPVLAQKVLPEKKERQLLLKSVM